MSNHRSSLLTALACALLVALASAGCGDSTPPPRKLPSDLRGAPLMNASVETDVADVPADISSGVVAIDPATDTDTDTATEPVVPATPDAKPSSPSEDFMKGGEPAVSLEGGDASREPPTLPEKANKPKPNKPDTAAKPDVPAPIDVDVAIGDVAEHVDPEPRPEDDIPFLSFDELASFRYIPEGLEEYGAVGQHAPEHTGGVDPAAGDTGAKGDPGVKGDAVDPEGDDPDGIPPPGGLQAAKTATPDEKPKNVIPDEIKKFDGKVVSIEGYMIPIEFDDGLVTEFILSRFIMGCCFGVVPAPNELVDVIMVSEEGAEYEAFLPIIVTGKLTVRGGDDKPGYMQGLYKLDGTSVRIAEPK